MAAGLLSTILDTTGERLKERLAQSHEMDKEMRDVQTKALVQSIYAVDENGNPRLSPQEAEEAWGKIEQLHKHNKAAKDILLKARDITGKIFGAAGSKNPALAKRAGQQTADALAGGQGGSLVGPQQEPAAPAPQPEAPAPQQQGPIDPNVQDAQPGLTEYTPPPPQRRQPVQQVASAASTQPLPAPPQRSTVGLMQAGAPNEIKETIAKENRANKEWTRREEIQHKSAIELAKAKFVPKTIQFKGKDGKMHVMLIDPRQPNPEDQILGEINSKGDVEPPRSWLSGAAISGTDAKKRAAAGEVFKTPDGEVIDVSKLGPEEELRAWAGGDAGAYSIFNQQTRQLIANNTVRTYPALDPTAQTVQGVSRVPTASVREEGMVDANNNPIAVPMRSISTPVTPGQPAPSLPGAPAPTTPTPPPARTTGGAGAGVPGTTPQSQTAPAPGPTLPGGARPLPGFKPAEMNSQLNVARPVRAAAVQLFGDPKNPDFESMATFAKLADDPKARERIGKAARLIINDLGAAEQHSPGVGLSVLGEGITANGGDIWSAIKNTTGITGWIAKSQFTATEKAIKDLQPAEVRYLNQVMASYGTLPGLRTITKGSALKFSTQSMERELPIIGFTDVPNSAAYYNKLGKLANEIVEGTKGVSDMIMPEKAYYQTEAQRLNGLGKGNTALPAPPARSGQESRVVNGTTYYKHADGKWYTTP